MPDFIEATACPGAPGPRAVQFLILGAKARALLQGRTHVTCEDIQACWPSPCFAIGWC